MKREFTPKQKEKRRLNNLRWRNEHKEENKIKRKIWSKAWLDRNREINKQKSKLYYKEHSEKLNNYSKGYYQEHKEEILIKKNNYRKDNAEKIKERKRKYRQNNREKVAKQVKVHRLRKRYGISIDYYNILFIQQNGECAICHQHQSSFDRALAVDHDHNTGNIRGLLCKDCNLALGHVKDNIKILYSMIKYLENLVM